jgi:hypothetical protein
MFSMLRSDWVPTMLAGFAIGALIVVLNQPAISIAL